MPNIADIIEEYIKTRLNQSTGGIIIIRRNELAERFRCVPSQINYVLSTRFSVNRGYIVETRRGGGGFVRVVKVSVDDAGDLLNIIYEKIGDCVSLTDALSLIRYLYDEEVITKREFYLMQNVLETATPNNRNHDTDKDRAVMLKAMVMVILRHQP